MTVVRVVGEEFRVVRCDVAVVEPATGRCPAMLDLARYERSNHWRALGWVRDGDLDICPFHAALPARRHHDDDRAARVAAARAVLAEYRATHDLTDDENLVLERTERFLQSRPPP